MVLPGTKAWALQMLTHAAVAACLETRDMLPCSAGSAVIIKATDAAKVGMSSVAARLLCLP